MRTAVNLSIGFEDAPKYTTKIKQAETIAGFVGYYSLGLHGFMDTDKPQLTKGSALLLRIAYAHTPKLNILMTFTITL